MSGDFTKLDHSGLYSVQLQPPGTTTPEPADPNADPNQPDTMPDMKPGGGNGKTPATIMAPLTGKKVAP